MLAHTYTSPDPRHPPHHPPRHPPPHPPQYLDAGEDAVAACGIDPEKDTKSFLNRLLGVPVALQNLIFSHFAAELDHQVKLAKENDKYDEGVVDIRGESISVASGFPVQLATDRVSGVALTHTKIQVDRGISHARAVELLGAKAASNQEGTLLKVEGFYRSRKPLIGREKEDLRGFAILIQKPVPTFALNHTPVYKVYRPSTGLGANTSLSDFTFGGRFQKVDEELAKKPWARAYNDALTVCSHGPNCKNKATCTVGKRNEEKHVISGSVLPYWQYIQNIVGYSYSEGARGSTKKTSRMNIVRVRYTDDKGKECRLVGIAVSTAAEIKKLTDQIAGAGSGGAGQADIKPDVKPDVKPRVGGYGPSSSSSSSAASQRYGGPSSSSSSSAAPQRYSKFAPVTVHGLQAENALKYNFAHAQVESFMADTGRYLVKVMAGPCRGDTLAVRPECLMYRR